MKCTLCGTESTNDRVCSACGRPFATQRNELGEDSVEVYETANPLQGRIIQGLLEAHGVPAALERLPTRRLTSYLRAPLHLYVRAFDEDEARAIIASADEGSFEIGTEDDS